MSFLRKLLDRLRDKEPEPAPAGIPPMPAPAAQEPAAVEPPPGSVSFPLKSITDLFPEALASALRKPASEHVRVHFPAERLTPQLASGAVRVSFGELCAATPAVFFNPDAAPRDARVALPLDLVLRQVSFVRRNEQRQPQIPVHIPSIFQKSQQPGQAGEAWYSQRRMTVEEAAPPGEMEAKPDAGAAQPRPMSKPAAIADQPLKMPDPAEPEPVLPGQPLAMPASAPGFGCIETPFHMVSADLPPEGVFRIPVEELEARMGGGRVVFSWGELSKWASMPILAPEGEIELPLQPLVPLFLARRKERDTRKMIAVDKRIPDLFAPVRAAFRHAAAAQAPSPIPSPAAVPAAAAPRETPSRVVEQLRKLGGIQGAFVASSDGLLVAGDTPSANGNLLAAFAPTVFAQVTKFADMARLGLPESIDIKVGAETAIHVRRAGKLFVGVVRPASHPLPDIAAQAGALQTH